MDKWLTVLQKVTTPVVTTPVSRKPGLSVESVFRDLVKVNDDEDDVNAPLTGAIYDGETPDASIADPIATAFEKAERDAFRVPVITAPHEDGIETERCGDVVWKFHWKDGRIERSECFDPELPGGSLVLEKRDLAIDGRHNATARFASPSGELETIDAAWEELLGGHAYPEKRQDLSADSKKKKVAAPETFNVGGQILAKSDLMSRMFRVVEQLRQDCIGQEYSLLGKAVRALDITAFAELAERVLARNKRAA